MCERTTPSEKSRWIHVECDSQFGVTPAGTILRFFDPTPPLVLEFSRPSSEGPQSRTVFCQPGHKLELKLGGEFDESDFTKPRRN